MRSFLILSFILFFFSTANAQQTIDKLNVNELKLPKESVSKALYLDAFGKVKASADITDTELGYLNGLSDTLVNLLSGKANSTDTVNLTGNQSISGIKTFTGKLVASSTINGSVPCPVMTQIQRDATTPANGECVFNSTTLRLNVYDGSIWKDVGGAGGISLWVTANPYAVNDIVIESDKIYRCTTIHTSGTFATDLGSGYWVEVSASPSTPYSLANGGTNKALTAVNGGIVWVDADSFEIISAGVSGQILQSNGAGAPSWVNKSISAKSENNVSVVAEELQVPNNQLTLTDTNKHLIESGNNNILSNPSFEHSTFSTGWVNSAGTFTAESSVLVHGKKSAKLVLSAQTMSLTQSSTLYQSQFADGVQGLASVRVKSDVALKVCAVQAGVVSTSLCVDVQANNRWGLYKVPFILGATSNGISVASTGAVSGTVYIDNAFVGAQELSLETTACNNINCETDFSAKISSAGVVSDENLDWISSISGSAGVYTLTISGFTVAPNCTLGMREIANNRIPRIDSTTATQVIIRTRDTGLSDAAGAFNIACQKQGADFTAAKQLSNGNTYSSLNKDTDWQSCGHTSSSFPNFGTVTAIETQCKRVGSDLLMRGNFTSGTTLAAEARINLPLWNGVQLTSAGTQKIASIQPVGSPLIFNANNANMFIPLVEPSVSYLAIGEQSGTSGGGFTKKNANTIVNPGIKVAFMARIPIEGWDNSNLIIGQFNGLERCIDSYECTDVFSAEVSAAGVVSAENLDWINGNASLTDTSLYTFTWKTGLFSTNPNCVVNVTNASQAFKADKESISTSTTGAFRTANSTTGAKAASGFTIICQKQGVDYVGKTAKAVASDQNLSTPGLTKAVVYSFEFGGASRGTVCNSSPCTIHANNGSAVASVTRSVTGDYTVNWSAGFWSDSNYQCSALGFGATTGHCGMYNTTLRTTSSMRIYGTATGASLNDVTCNIICHGVRP